MSRTQIWCQNFFLYPDVARAREGVTSQPGFSKTTIPDLDFS